MLPFGLDLRTPSLDSHEIEGNYNLFENLNDRLETNVLPYWIRGVEGAGCQQTGGTRTRF